MATTLKCNNCGKALSCSCKVRTASDKNSCCSACLPTYEASIKKPK